MLPYPRPPRGAPPPHPATSAVEAASWWRAKASAACVRDGCVRDCCGGASCRGARDDAGRWGDALRACDIEREGAERRVRVRKCVVVLIDARRDCADVHAELADYIAECCEAVTQVFDRVVERVGEGG